MIMLKDNGQVFFSYLLPHSRLSASGRCIGYRGSDYLSKLRPMLALNIVLMLACVYFNILDGAVKDPAQRFYATEFVVIAYLFVKAAVLPVKAFEPGPRHEVHPVSLLVWLELGTHFGLIVELALIAAALLPHLRPVSAGMLVFMAVVMAIPVCTAIVAARRRVERG